MREQTWILDLATGALVAEGMEAREVAVLTGDLLPPAQNLNCARPLNSMPLSSEADTRGPTLRVARLYHESVVDGPGRRSVVQLQGCPIRCRGCFVPETHDPRGGILLTIGEVVKALLDPVGEPRDGITVLGGATSPRYGVERFGTGTLLGRATGNDPGRERTGAPTSSYRLRVRKCGKV